MHVMSKFRKCSFALALCSLPLLTTFAQEATWITTTQKNTSIIENIGQFSGRVPNCNNVQYGYESSTANIFFSNTTVYFQLYEMNLHEKTLQERQVREERKRQGFDSTEDWHEFEREGHKMDFTTDYLTAEWIGANPNTLIVPSEKDEFTHGYEFYQGDEIISKTGIESFQKITFKNIYPNIDIEYIIHPESGIKYNIILHTGADITQVKLRYSKTPELMPDGALSTESIFGKIIDHAPVTYYQNGQKIDSEYNLDGNEITFELSTYDNTQTIIIDPWTDLPNDASTNWDCAWECETDLLGNSYAIYGANKMMLRKYDATGAIQWSYNTTYDTTSWLGTFVVDDAGNSYVTNGTFAQVRKVNTAGVLQWTANGTAMLSEEFWNIAFNCDQTSLVIGGTGGALPPLPYIYNMDMNTGAITAQQQMTGSGLFNVQEVRAITATENEKYYWLTHDSIGYVAQDLGLCPGQSSVFHVSNGYNLGYQCENWRYNNSGIEAIAYYGGYVYINRGDRIDKREFNTANIVASGVIPGGTFTAGFGGNYVRNSGIIIDANGRIFVGSQGSVEEFDINCNHIATYAVTAGYNVYDVDLTSSGQLIACGASGTRSTASRTGYVESLGTPYGQAPYVMTCCNATICLMDPLCDGDGPVTLTTYTGGGTFTSSAPGFTPATGVFDPAVAGPGTYTFYYTLACGTDSIDIDVISCVSMNVCLEGNGDLTVNGGTGPYTWDEGTLTVGPCVFAFSSACGAFSNYPAPTWNWTNFATGSTVTPPVGADTVRVTDNNGTEIEIYDISALPACAVLPAELISFTCRQAGESEVDVEWITASEVNNDYFTLQSSSDGIYWNTIATVQGAGNSSFENVYNRTDHTPSLPMTYYRLFQTDFDGTTKYLGTITMNMETVSGFEVIDLYPNPAHDWLSFTYKGEITTKPLQVMILNPLGEVVSEQVYTDLTPFTQSTLNIASLSNGLYQVLFTQGELSTTQKLVISR